MLEQKKTILYHIPICPLSRQVRILLFEFNIPFTPKSGDINDDQNMKDVCSPQPPHMTTMYPILDIQLINQKISFASGIFAYIQSQQEYNRHEIWGKTSDKKKDILYNIYILNTFLYHDVFACLLYEKILKRYFQRNSLPDSSIIRNSQYNAAYYMKYFNDICIKRSWIACEDFSICDIVCAAHITSLDYMSIIDWKKYFSFKRLVYENEI